MCKPGTFKTLKKKKKKKKKKKITRALPTETIVNETSDIHRFYCYSYLFLTAFFPEKPDQSVEVSAEIKQFSVFFSVGKIQHLSNENVFV